MAKRKKKPAARRGVKNRVKEIRMVKASELHGHPDNWRLHPKRQQAAMKGVLKEVGFASAIVARELPDGSLQIIDGHLRAEVTGSARVPVLIVDLDDDEARKVLVARAQRYGAQPHRDQ